MPTHCLEGLSWGQLITAFEPTLRQDITMVSAAEGEVPSVHQAKRHRKRPASQRLFQGMSPENQVSSVRSHLPKVPSASLDATS